MCAFLKLCIYSLGFLTANTQYMLNTPLPKLSLQVLKKGWILVITGTIFNQ